MPRGIGWLLAAVAALVLWLLLAEAAIQIVHIVGEALHR